MENSIRVQRDIISMEALNPASALKALTKRLPGYVASVRNFIQTTLSAEAPSISPVNTRGLEKKLRNKNYMDITGLTVYTPPGLVVPYIEYIGTLKRCQDVVDALIPETLDPFAKWLAVLLTNPEQMKSLRANPASIGVKIHDIESIKKSATKCIDVNSGETEATFGDVFERISDVPRVQKELNDLSARFSAVNRKELVAKVDQINELLARLISKVENKEDGFQMSGQVLDSLAKLTYSLGEQVEFYSVYGYQLQSLNQAIEDTVKSLEKEIK